MDFSQQLSVIAVRGDDGHKWWEVGWLVRDSDVNFEFDKRKMFTGSK